jgi:hypothetical protein
MVIPKFRALFMRRGPRLHTSNPISRARLIFTPSIIPTPWVAIAIFRNGFASDMPRLRHSQVVAISAIFNDIHNVKELVQWLSSNENSRFSQGLADS